ncbi:uncharacterized membrane protein YgdD (TMEM256/DUF423 family) [Tenacibaculum adriaticum]|uniref:Uncharacterized membrane protein YgdD (TMEM256/DUF423 family) n=1 Tax=Tenacibaculum adriaticum TaxID=413713 RepID=A0A5S5DXW4_9FLAO|nr:DUF423 domain-containing protein [Tenacibaculum adriaticum]TYP99449.1 uncharacterized membrane protein YgdD (TMEM256/DUF423 family) [Tenacibaculum adriaticum]
MYKNLTITSLLGALTIILGAFGAHALKKQLSVEAMQSFETAVRYQMYHVLVLLVINLYDGFSEKMKRTLTLLFTAGILFFSGSIYLINLFGVSAKSIWFITPLGGLLFIMGWSLLFYKFLKISLQK